MKRWRTDEDNILIRYYPDEGSDVCKRLTGRTKDSCKRRARILHLSFRHPHNRKNMWTKEDQKILETYYPLEGGSCTKRLPNRTINAIANRASRTKICSSYRRWTESEIEIIKKYYPVMGIKVNSLLPNRTKAACYRKAANLKKRGELLQNE